MERAVVTGPTGVVGSALVKELHRQGVEQLLLVRGDSPNYARLEGLVRELTRGGSGAGITVKACPLDELKHFEDDSGTRWDVFYHLGWCGTKGKDRYDPYIHNRNVEYSLDAVQLSKRLGCSAFVGAGSQAEYGRSDERLTPDTPARPENAYGIAKLCAGQLTREYARMLGIRHVWTRILSVFGPNDGEATLITSVIRKLKAGEVPAVTAGEQIWDFVSSRDAARALYLLGERGRDGETYLIASGREKTLRSYLEDLLAEVAPGGALGYGQVPYAERQVMHLSADISKTTADTGWKPELSFREGLRDMIAGAQRL